MAFDTATHVVGNLSADPEVADIPGGGKVANLTIIVNPRIYDHQTGRWKDADPVAVRCNAWRGFAENIPDTLRKGTRVVAVGRLKTNRFTDSKGVERENLEMDIDAIGPDLKYATAVVTKRTRA
jgi:single-strand DNA-binding protein